MTDLQRPAPGAAPRIGLVLLAAGGSTRMGQPKQLLCSRGSPLIVHAVEAALVASVWPVVVVLGHAAPMIRPLLAKFPLLLAENQFWSAGMGSSIRLGIQTLNRFSASLDGAILALADQPALSAAALNRLVTAFRENPTFVAARYAGALGSPALFPQSSFAELLQLPPKTGAQGLLQKYAEQVMPIDLPELSVDLDTLEDYERWSKAQT